QLDPVRSRHRLRGPRPGACPHGVQPRFRKPGADGDVLRRAGGWLPAHRRAGRPGALLSRARVLVRPEGRASGAPLSSSHRGGIGMRRLVSVLVAAAVFAGCTGPASTAKPSTQAPATVAPASPTAAVPTDTAVRHFPDGSIPAGTYSFLNG